MEGGFSSLSDMLCRIAEVDLSRYSQSAALRQWYYTDGSKGGLQAMINAQYRFFAPDLSAEGPRGGGRLPERDSHSSTGREGKRGTGSPRLPEDRTISGRTRRERAGRCPGSERYGKERR